MSCIFCDIVAGTHPAFIVYQDDNFIAFLDKYPKTWGHTQVIPKKHYRWVWDQPNVLDHFAVVSKLVTHYKQILNIPSCYLAIWGNQIPHAHIHILPKYKPLHQPQLLDEHQGLNIQQQLKLTR